MIDLSKFETGKVDLDKIPTNVDEFIPQICSRFEPQASWKKIALNVNVASTIPTIELDVYMIEQVMVNLVDNAIKYTPAGGERYH
jgi:signal transduction histidine kinase